MKKILSVNPKSVAKVFAVMYGVMGIVMGAIMLFTTLFAGFEILAVVFALIVPILYAGMGAAFGFVSAWLYNAIAKRVGGIEIEVA